MDENEETIISSNLITRWDTEAMLADCFDVNIGNVKDELGIDLQEVMTTYGLK